MLLKDQQFPLLSSFYSGIYALTINYDAPFFQLLRLVYLNIFKKLFWKYNGNVNFVEIYDKDMFYGS